MEPALRDRTRVTAEDLQHLRPEEDDHHYELDGGELILVPPTGPIHGDIEARMVGRLLRFVEERRIGKVVCGEVGFQLAHDTVRAPDVAFLSEGRLKAVPFPRDGFYPGAPDLAIEVLSPGDAAGELLRKAGRFLEAGASLVWILDPRRRLITVYRREGPISLLHPTDVLRGESVLPGFECPVGELLPAEEK